MKLAFVGTPSNRQLIVIEAMIENGWEVEFFPEDPCGTHTEIDFPPQFWFDEMDYYQCQQHELSKDANPKKEHSLQRRPAPYYQIKDKY